MCGTRTYSIQDTNNGNAVVSWAHIVGTSTFTIIVSPNSNNLFNASPYSLRLHVVLTSYTGVTGDIPFTVNVSQYVCNSSTIYTPVPAAMLTAYTYQIGAGDYTFTAPTFSTAPYSCNESVTYALVK